MQYVPPKDWLTSKGPQSIISQKIVHFMRRQFTRQIHLKLLSTILHILLEAKIKTFSNENAKNVHTYKAVYI
jgi:hypothetical protein